MTKTTSPNPTTPSILSANATGLIAHTYVRVRGDQTGKIDVYNARTPQARVTMTLGTVLMTFWSASAAQGVLEGVSAARATLSRMPAQIPATADPYGQPTIAVDWTTRPNPTRCRPRRGVRSHPHHWRAPALLKLHSCRTTSCIRRRLVRCCWR